MIKLSDINNMPPTDEDFNDINKIMFIPLDKMSFEQFITFMKFYDLSDFIENDKIKELFAKHGIIVD
jgi:hypothetical protein